MKPQSVKVIEPTVQRELCFQSICAGLAQSDGKVLKHLGSHEFECAAIIELHEYIHVEGFTTTREWSATAIDYLLLLYLERGRLPTTSTHSWDFRNKGLVLGCRVCTAKPKLQHEESTQRS